jgi:hypothetical protein
MVGNKVLNIFNDGLSVGTIKGDPLDELEISIGFRAGALEKSVGNPEKEEGSCDADVKFGTDRGVGMEGLLISSGLVAVGIEEFVGSIKLLGIIDEVSEVGIVGDGVLGNSGPSVSLVGIVVGRD